MSRGSDAPAGRLSLGQIADASVGLMGVQIVWGLQNVSLSRIFQTLGARIADLPILWIAAPVTGLLVQPLVGWLSDRTSTRFGRRRPYLAFGGLLTAGAMIAMANATSLAAAVVALWLMTASVNIAMQPMRALLADILPAEQRATGYAVQVVFIGLGAVLASCLPWLLGEALGDTYTATGLPSSVRLAFWMGSACLLACIGWTFARTIEPTAPGTPPLPLPQAERSSVRDGFAPAGAWVIGGLAIALAAWSGGLRREIYLVAVIAAGFGASRAALVWRRESKRPISGPLQIIEDLLAMPGAMRRLAAVQFFTWFGLFAMWIYAVPSVAWTYYGTKDALSPGYGLSADWVGILFALHDAVATTVALLLPRIVAKVGSRQSYGLSLALGAAGLLGIITVPSPAWLWVPALGIGAAWASILSAPYAIVANSVPPSKVGVYMGIHNIFLVLPQLVAASLLGVLLEHAFDGDASTMMLLAAAAFLAAALLVWRIPNAEVSAAR